MDDSLLFSWMTHGWLSVPFPFLFHPPPSVHPSIHSSIHPPFLILPLVPDPVPWAASAADDARASDPELLVPTPTPQELHETHISLSHHDVINLYASLLSGTMLCCGGGGLIGGEGGSLLFASPPKGLLIWSEDSSSWREDTSSFLSCSLTIPLRNPNFPPFSATGAFTGGEVVAGGEPVTTDDVIMAESGVREFPFWEGGAAVLGFVERVEEVFGDRVFPIGKIFIPHSAIFPRSLIPEPKNRLFALGKKI